MMRSDAELSDKALERIAIDILALPPRNSGAVLTAYAKDLPPLELPDLSAPPLDQLRQGKNHEHD